MSDESAERRSNDSVVNLLRDRIDSVEKAHGDAVNDVKKGLADHLTECSKNYKYLMFAVLLLSALHSPEALKLAIELIRGFLP